MIQNLINVFHYAQALTLIEWLNLNKSDYSKWVVFKNAGDNENEHWNLWDITKAMFRGKSVALNAYIRNEENDSHFSKLKH